MSYLLVLGCYLVAFSPAAALFLRLAAADPLKTILFVVGAFVWLLSLLLTSLLWVVVFPLKDQLWFAMAAGIVFQEAARVACFFMLRVAQKGLASMANPSSAQHVRITGVMSLANSRHLLAVVIGLGMGTMAALFLTMNAFDAISGSAVMGGLKQTLDGKPLSSPLPRLLPLHWAINAALLSLLNIPWTVLIWDSCHHFALRREAAAAAATPQPSGDGASGSSSAAAAATPATPLLQNAKRAWALPAAVAAGTHVASTAVSYLSSAGWPWLAISLKSAMLLGLLAYCYTIVRHDSPFQLLKECAFALRDWVTLAALREACSKKQQQQPAAAAAASSNEDEVVVRDAAGGGSSSVRQRREERT